MFMTPAWSSCLELMFPPLGDFPMRQQSIQFSSPLPLAGEGQGGGNSTAQTSLREPPPQPSPASGGGSRKTRPMTEPVRPRAQNRSPEIWRDLHAGVNQAA